jgi:hypothetical protein
MNENKETVCPNGHLLTRNVAFCDVCGAKARSSGTAQQVSDAPSDTKSSSGRHVRPVVPAGGGSSDRHTWRGEMKKWPMWLKIILGITGLALSATVVLGVAAAVQPHYYTTIHQEGSGGATILDLKAFVCDEHYPSDGSSPSSAQEIFAYVETGSFDPVDLVPLTQDPYDPYKPTLLKESVEHWYNLSARQCAQYVASTGQ